jgi:hypothetical protein
MPDPSKALARPASEQSSSPITQRRDRKEALVRKFLVGACCVIVGLQIVAAAAAMLVLGVVAAMGGVHAPYAVRHDGPAVYVDDPLRPTPAVPAVTRATWDEPPADAPADPPPTDPLVESILDYREEVGSPLSGTLLEGDPTSPAAAHEMGAILARVSAESPAAPPAAESPAPVQPGLPPFEVPPVSTANCPAGASSPLAAAVEHLYGHANQHETRGEFARADQLRELARRIRQEIEIGGEAFPPGSVSAPPAPPAVPDEAENPAETPAAEPESAESAIPAS